ncbi:hypothetical protein ILUMI_16948 [Ignelater luminosus]|uniref:Helitron helicase-like domain-containing protein n=1 Tax=Ignelater luminosus TaxID=2038154 RepID=A0A8K0CTC4_IGNLU|nr:hypothetical protein ILUMI_16948 [Ignelater luminosus]
MPWANEERGLLVPQFDMESRGAPKMKDTVAATQHDPQLGEMIFPCLYPYGIGGFVRGKGWTHAEYHNLLTKEQIQAYNNIRVSEKSQKTRPKKKDARFGNATTMVKSRTYWCQKSQELSTFFDVLKRPPHLFVTLAQNDSWPDMRAIIREGIHCRIVNENKTDTDYLSGNRGAVNYPLEMVKTFYRRLAAFSTEFLHKKNDVFGEVEDYWMRIEYQNRGSLHARGLVWCKLDTVPLNVVSAEMLRFDHPSNEGFASMCEL